MFKFCKCVSCSLAVACCILVNGCKIILDTFLGRLLLSNFISVTFFLLYFYYSINFKLKIFCKTGQGKHYSFLPGDIKKSEKKKKSKVICQTVGFKMKLVHRMVDKRICTKCIYKDFF